MRILDQNGKKSLGDVTLYLTFAEAGELRDSLEALLSGVPSYERHEHVASEEDSRELTVCIYDLKNIDAFDQQSRDTLLGP